MPHWAPPGEVRWRLFSRLLSGHPLFTSFWDFYGFLAETGAKMEDTLAAEWHPFSRNSDTFAGEWPQWAPRGPKASKKTPKWSPRVPKWSPKASQIEVLGLKTVVKKGREFRPFRRSTTHTTHHNTPQHNTTQRNATQRNATQHTAPHHTTPHNTTQHNTTQHNESVNQGIPASMHP